MERRQHQRPVSTHGPSTVRAHTRLHTWSVALRPLCLSPPPPTPPGSKRKIKLEGARLDTIREFDCGMLQRQRSVGDTLARHKAEQERLRKMQEYVDLVDRDLAIKVGEGKLVTEERKVRS